jgi:hypothetical protein
MKKMYPHKYEGLFVKSNQISGCYSNSKKNWKTEIKQNIDDMTLEQNMRKIIENQKNE